MKKLCSSLRSFSSTLATNKRMHDLNAVAKALKDSFDAGMACDLELELGDLPLAFIDPEEMTRVLHNLVLNAIEASSGTPVRVTTRKQEGALVVEVQDRGKGIPREFMEQELFQPFHTTKKDGLGIGLFQSRKIVEAHQGTIEVRSTEGTGTLVRILLPVVEGKRQQAAQAAAAGEFQILANPQTAE
jgi:signal transduction histidine kinase